MTDKHYAHYLTVQQYYTLDILCLQVNDAFRSLSTDDERDWSVGHTYLVGSCLTKPDFRDVDVRFIMSDSYFNRLYPFADDSGFSPYLKLINVGISQWLSIATGLHVDFQIQKQSIANAKHKGLRNAIGIRISDKDHT
jgi:hypothetical protein